MARSFVTGGSGFLGRNLIAALRARGDEVRALARSDGAVAAVRAAGAEPVRGDLDDVDAMARGMAGCEVVFHSAADTAQFGDLEKIAHINVGGTERAIAAARAAKVGRLVHVSTEAVLVGGPRIVRADESWPRPAHPIGVYPITKGRAEAAVLAANSPTLTTVIARPRFIWGAGDTSVLPVLVASVKSGQFRWIGGGRHLTSSCHVKNVCAGLIACAERGRGGEIYFLTDGQDVEVRGFLTQLLDAEGIRAPDGALPYWLARAAAWAAELFWKLARKSGEPPVTRSAVRLIGDEVTVDDSKARREIGYAPVITREAGLEEIRRAGAAQRPPASA
jgi:nucleoside-diphosphate-sugar epimerase